VSGDGPPLFEASVSRAGFSIGGGYTSRISKPTLSPCRNQGKRGHIVTLWIATPAGIAQVSADAGRFPDPSMLVVDTALRVMPSGKEDTEEIGAFGAERTGDSRP